MNGENLKLQSMPRLVATVVVLVLVLGAGGAARDVQERWNVHEFTYEEARDRALTPLAARTPARAAATWCGAPTQKDLIPNTVAGHPVHWVYAMPSDGPDRFSTYASIMQTDSESIDSWWRSQDPLRTLRSDLTQLSCGLQLDLSLIRLSQTGSQLGSIDSRFPQIADALIGLQFSSRHTKYVVYYDGPVEPDICGEGGSDSSGLGFALVYVQACLGVPWNTTAAHELLHTLGAVPDGAPHMCSAPEDGHVCDNSYDMLFPSGDETPIMGLALDSGRDDYYGHPGSWPDMQDSHWLVQFDRQVPLALTISGPGSVSADVPGLQCGQSCTTNWNAGPCSPFVRRPRPARSSSVGRSVLRGRCLQRLGRRQRSRPSSRRPPIGSQSPCPDAGRCAARGRESRASHGVRRSSRRTHRFGSVRLRLRAGASSSGGAHAAGHSRCALSR